MKKLIKLPKRALKTNVVYCADNLEVMKQLPPESIHLIYVDPPFNTGTLRKSKAWDKEVQVGDFDDKWGGGINSYVLWLENRLREMHRLLKSNGVLCVHLDYKSVHYVKVCLDKLFGYGNPDKGAKHLVNEIVWAYKSGGASKKTFSKKHDTILCYSKTNKYTFNPQTEKSYNREFKPYNFKGVEEFYEELEFCKAENKCKLYYTIINARDVFNIDMVGRTSSERCGYPTQNRELY